MVKFLIFFSTGLRLDFGTHRRGVNASGRHSRFFEDALFVLSGLFSTNRSSKTAL